MFLSTWFRDAPSPASPLVLHGGVRDRCYRRLFGTQLKASSYCDCECAKTLSRPLHRVGVDAPCPTPLFSADRISIPGIPVTGSWGEGGRRRRRRRLADDSPALRSRRPSWSARNARAVRRIGIIGEGSDLAVKILPTFEGE